MLEASSPRAAPTRSDDSKFCEAALPAVSRTFALSIEALPVDLRDAVRTAYLLCRIVDTVEDEAKLPWAHRLALFDEFDSLIQDDTRAVEAFEQMSTSLHDHDQSAELCRRAGCVFRVYRGLSPRQRAAIRPHVLEMANGMREYARRADTEGGLQLRDIPDLERYCYFVAGTVGKLLTDLFLEHCPLEDEGPVRTNAVGFGLGLQLTNIVKDVAVDFERDDCFLPARLAEAHGISLRQLLQPEHREAGLSVVRAVCSRARHHLAAARDYTLAWPADRGAQVRLFCSVPLALAIATLAHVEEGSETLVLGKVPKISRAATQHLFSRALSAVESDAALAQLFECAAEAPC